MAYEGELTKLENGRWARFQRCRIVNAGHQDCDETTLLVAIELDDRYQELLNAAEDSIELHRRRGVPVEVRIDPDGKGKIRLEFDAPSATVQ